MKPRLYLFEHLFAITYPDGTGMACWLDIYDSDEGIRIKRWGPCPYRDISKLAKVEMKKVFFDQKKEENRE
jgi:hypothetical protein